MSVNKFPSDSSGLIRQYKDKFPADASTFLAMYKDQIFCHISDIFKVIKVLLRTINSIALVSSPNASFRSDVFDRTSDLLSFSFPRSYFDDGARELILKLTLQVSDLRHFIERKKEVFSKVHQHFNLLECQLDWVNTGLVNYSILVMFAAALPSDLHLPVPESEVLVLTKADVQFKQEPCSLPRSCSKSLFRGSTVLTPRDVVSIVRRSIPCQLESGPFTVDISCAASDNDKMLFRQFDHLRGHRLPHDFLPLIRRCFPDYPDRDSLRAKLPFLASLSESARLLQAYHIFTKLHRSGKVNVSYNPQG